ncbi:MAG: nucleotidyltransferase family protein [Thermoproteota archaeon]
MKVHAEEEVIALLRKHKEELKRYGVKRMGLSGSFTRDEPRKKSDVDLVVEFEESYFGNDFKGLYDAYLSLSRHLRRLLG